MDSQKYLEYSQTLDPDGWLPFERNLWKQWTKGLTRSDPLFSIDRLIDIGAGFGKLAFLISDRLNVPYSGVYALEPDEVMMQAAKQDITQKGMNLIQSTFQEADLTHLEESVDLVVANMVYHFFDDEAFNLAMTKALEVLRPGGYCAYLEPHTVYVPLKRKDGPYLGSTLIDNDTPWGEKIRCWHRTLEQYSLLTSSAIYTSGGNKYRFAQCGLLEYPNFEQGARVLLTFRKTLISYASRQ